jgi:hypothetical protein
VKIQDAACKSAALKSTSIIAFTISGYIANMEDIYLVLDIEIEDDTDHLKSTLVTDDIYALVQPTG